MSHDVVGLGNALMDALVVVEHADELLAELGLIRGTMHPVNHEEWDAAYQRVASLGVKLESGGSCANTIATVGRLGGKALYCGQIGDDELGRTYTSRIVDACGAHALRVSNQGPTGKCLSIVSGEDAERTMLTDLGASVLLPELGDFATQLASARIAHFTGYTLLGGPMHDTAMAAMRIARDGGALVSLDVADPFVVSQIRDKLWHVIDAFADIVFLNAEEARALTDQTPEHAAETIAKEARVRTVIVKLGARGSVVVHEGKRHEIAVERVAAVDTTGAGDAYAGGFLHALVQGWDAAAAGALGSAVAAATVSQLGAVVTDNGRLADIVARLSPRAA